MDSVRRLSGRLRLGMEHLLRELDDAQEDRCMNSEAQGCPCVGTVTSKYESILSPISTLQDTYPELQGLSCIDELAHALETLESRDLTPDIGKLNACACDSVCCNAPVAVTPAEFNNMQKDLTYVRLKSLDDLHDSFVPTLNAQGKRYCDGIRGIELTKLLQALINDFGDGTFGKEDEEICGFVQHFVQEPFNELHKSGKKGMLLTDGYAKVEQKTIKQITNLSRDLSEALPGQCDRHSKLMLRADAMEDLIQRIDERFDEVRSWDSLKPMLDAHRTRFQRERDDAINKKREHMHENRRYAAIEKENRQRLQTLLSDAESRYSEAKARVADRCKERAQELKDDMIALREVCARIMQLMTDEFDDLEFMKAEEAKLKLVRQHAKNYNELLHSRITLHEQLSQRWQKGEQLIERVSEWIIQAYAGIERHALSTHTHLRDHLPRDVLKHDMLSRVLSCDMSRQIEMLNAARATTENNLLHVEEELLRLEHSRSGPFQKSMIDTKSKAAEELKADIQEQTKRLENWQEALLDLKQHKEEFEDKVTHELTGIDHLQNPVSAAEKQSIRDLVDSMFFNSDRPLSQLTPGVRYDVQVVSNRAWLSGAGVNAQPSLQDSASVSSDLDISSFERVGSEAHTVASAPARMISQHCLLPEAFMVDANGQPLQVSTMSVQVALISDVSLIEVHSATICQSVNRDVTRIVCNGGSVEMTADHLVAARHCSNHRWNRFPASEVKRGMQLRTFSGEPALVQETETREKATQVLKIVFQPGDAVAYLCGEGCGKEFAIGVYAPPDPLMLQRIDPVRRSVDIIEVFESKPQTRSDPGVASSRLDMTRLEELPGSRITLSAVPSVGSHGHPDACKGACRNALKGACKYGKDCRNCHSKDCKPYRPGQRQRRAAKAGNSSSSHTI
eukprot:TRINITY_DN26697_c0_g2_i1.p1 TRINITY_DN26697_c0_g2~~TRINITY_DN26697_c0_g2_i1.p1  ORF type:complete len:924 (-),score=82.02 TRINITY_DN26697_c0_g2_i1:210-2927(-)